MKIVNFFEKKRRIYNRKLFRTYISIILQNISIDSVTIIYKQKKFHDIFIIDFFNSVIFYYKIIRMNQEIKFVCSIV